ncbi:sensor histidine kinase [Actinomadura algeriensis]|uniref:histidine kinase n=1 Tax=Actinomadura algeriensis TaxID=1679523 RepID=A0ABR9JMN2_9ACTN|nr:nitrate- and nitrite sensing domain-containing protein [Actinomadura algeriensis]MBE1531646.1 HAMP domain-containing protein [Actinomadura algeriensis]
MRLSLPFAARRDRPRNIRLRARIVFMMSSLVALWIFAAWVTTQEGYDLLQTGQRDETAGRPTKALVNVLQDERRASMVFLGGSGQSAAATELRQRRAHTDRMVDQWRATAPDAPGDKIKQYVAATSRELNTLSETRAAIDAGTIDRSAAARSFNETIDAALLINSAAAELSDPEISADGRALIELTRAREMLAREDAMLAGVLAEGRFRSAAEFIEFAQAVSLRTNAEQRAYRQLPAEDRRRYDGLRRGDAYGTLQQLESQVLQRQGARGRVGVTAQHWHAATKPVLTQIDQAIDAGGDAVVERAAPIGYMVAGQWAGAAVLGAIAVAACLALAFTAARQLLQQLNRLRDAAQDLAQQRLPDVMSRLSAGEQVDVAVEAPPLRFGTDEIGQVGQAFNAVQEAAITAAAGQAAQREASRKILLNLAQRTRVMMAQQLNLVDAMEKRRDIDLRQLKELFQLDQLTVRGQRYVDNLIVLAGGRTVQRARASAPLIDVIRAAVGQVEGYERVNLRRISAHRISGYAIGDTVSLFAELIDNAVSYSPHTVDIESDVTARGIAVTIDDRGLGLSDDQIERINTFLAQSPEFLTAQFSAGEQAQLGHFVVAIRARHHDITVTLKKSPYGGVTAVVLIPSKLLHEQAPEPRPDRPARTAPPETVPAGAVAAAGRAEPHGNVSLLHKDRPGPALTAVAEQEPAEDLPTPPAHTEPPVNGTATEPDEPSQTLEIEATPNGLPVRRPQENLVPALRTTVPVVEEVPQTESGELRDPEDIRRIFGSYQRGTRQGRADAAPTPADAGDEQSPGDEPSPGDHEPR